MCVSFDLFAKQIQSSKSESFPEITVNNRSSATHEKCSVAIFRLPFLWNVNFLHQRKCLTFALSVIRLIFFTLRTNNDSSGLRDFQWFPVHHPLFHSFLQSKEQKHHLLQICYTIIRLAQIYNIDESIPAFKYHFISIEL